MPTIIIRGDLDTQAPGPLQLDLFADLATDRKVFVTVACASHFPVWENQHMILLNASAEWLRSGTFAGQLAGSFVIGTDGREGRMNLTEAAHVVGINAKTLRLALERGEIEADHPLADGPWVFKPSVLDTPAAATLVARVRRRTQEVTIPSAQQGTLGFSRVFTT